MKLCHSCTAIKIKDNCPYNIKSVKELPKCIPNVIGLKNWYSKNITQTVRFQIGKKYAGKKGILLCIKL